MMSRQRWIILGLVLIVAATASYFVFRKKTNEGDLHREFTITRGDLETSIVTTGEVKPENRLEIKPPLAGRVEQILVREGQVVSSGQILGWMSSTERAALLDAALAKGPDELKHWEELYRPTPIMAPLNGTIIYRQVETGQTFGANDTILIMSDRLLVKALVDETDLAQIKNRQKARITLDAYPDEPMNGVVHKISYESKVTNNVTVYVVDILPDKTPSYMRSGMTANITFMIEARENVVLAPSETVIQRGNDRHVLMKDAEGKPAPHPVKVGLSDGKNTEIVEGLKEGDIVLSAKPQTSANKDESNPLFGGRPRGPRR